MRRPFPFLPALLPFLVLAPAVLPAQQAPETFRLLRLEGAAEPRIEVEDLRRDVEFLASKEMRGREAGAPEADEAAAHIAARFARAELAPAGVEEWFQELEVSLGRQPGPGNLLEVRGPGGHAVLSLEEGSMAPLAHTGTGRAQGELAFAGFGIVDGHSGRDDYAGLEVEGRIVVVLRGAPPGSGLRGGASGKVRAARERGAVGLIEMDPSAGEAARIAFFRASRFDAGIPSAAARAGPLLRALPQLAAALEEPGKPGKPASTILEGAAATLSVDVVEKTGRTRNVLGLLRGSHPRLAEEIVVVGAHYDGLGLGIEGSLDPAAAGRIHPGADDNASGTAVLMALAETLAGARAGLGRSVLFAAFTAEEKGLLGSRHFLAHPTVPRDRIVAMVNLDMVGRSAGGSVLAIATATSPLWEPLLAAVSPDGRIRTGAHSPGGSDHMPFLEAGIPAVHFFTGVHEDYHRPGDVPEKVEYASMAEIARMVLDVVAHLSLMEERPAFVPPPAPPPMPRAAGPSAWLGTIPSYAEAEGGVRLDGTVPDSPAHAAGLAKDDVVVRIGEHRIDNIHDLVHALRAHAPGQRAEVVVLREGKEVRLEVRFGSR